MAAAARRCFGLRASGARRSRSRLKALRARKPMTRLRPQARSRTSSTPRVTLSKRAPLPSRRSHWAALSVARPVRVLLPIRYSRPHTRLLPIRLTMGLSVRADTNSPILIYTAPSRSEARYPATTGPQSRSAISAALTGRGRVASSASSSRPLQAKNLPSTNRQIPTGCTSTCSSVPVRRSSLHMRMVSAALSGISSSGIQSNSGRTSAILRANQDSTQKKINRVSPANAARNSQATGEPKNSRTSFCATRRITLFVVTVPASPTLLPGKCCRDRAAVAAAETGWHPLAPHIARCCLPRCPGLHSRAA